MTQWRSEVSKYSFYDHPGPLDTSLTPSDNVSNKMGVKDGPVPGTNKLTPPTHAREDEIWGFLN